MIYGRYSVTTPPEAEPVTADECRTHARASTITGENDWFTLNIKAAREAVEAYCGIALITQTITWWLDSAPSGSFADRFWRLQNNWPLLGSSPNSVLDYLEVPKPPLSSVTSITSYDETDTGTVFDSENYNVHTAVPPYRGRISLKFGKSWPVSLRERDALKIIYVAGYGSSGSSVPAQLRLAIIQLVATAYNNREDIITEGSVAKMPRNWHALVSPYRVPEI